MSFHPIGAPGWVLAAGLTSAALSWAALHYAHWRQVLDMPGRRRSHVTPTPRGGGVAITLTLLLALPWLGWGDLLLPAGFALGLGGVAAIGWVDDHRPLRARTRLVMHLFAALVLVTLLLQVYESPLPRWALIISATLAFFWLVGCINAWNFMDGSNGLVTSQCIWLGLMLAHVFSTMTGEGTVGAAPWAGVALILAAANIGFLPFNFPRAAIFLGDVGSGALGLTCGLLLLVAAWLDPGRVWVLFLLPSALLVDAGMTLAWRIIAGRRWYTAHREHLYQWLIRSGRSHTQVALLYLGWNLVVIVPAYSVIRHQPTLALPVTVAMLSLMAGLWWLGKSSLLSRGTRKRLRRQGQNS